MSKRRKAHGRWWTFTNKFDMTGKASVCEELGRFPDAAVFVLNLRACMIGDDDEHKPIPFARGFGPCVQPKWGHDRGRFHALRLGLVEIILGARQPERGGAGGRGFPPQYKLAKKWIDYDPMRPGRFVKEAMFAPDSWKQLFDENDQWKLGVNLSSVP